MYIQQKAFFTPYASSEIAKAPPEQKKKAPVFLKPAQIDEQGQCYHTKTFVVKFYEEEIEINEFLQYQFCLF